MKLHSSNHFDNPFTNQFPVIAGRIERFDRVVMEIPSIVKIVAELFVRVRGEKPVPHDSLSSQVEFPAFEIVISISIGAITLLFLNPLLAIGLGVITFAGSRYMGVLEDSANARHRQDLFNSFSRDDIQLLAKAAIEFSYSEVFKKIVWDMTGDPTLNDELPGFVASYFIYTETLSDYAKSLQAESNQLSPSRIKVVNALRFFFSPENTKSIEHGRLTQHHLLSAQLIKLQQRCERRQVYRFG